MEDEDLIQREDMVVTVSHAGYVKRVPLSTYRAQKPRRQGPRRHADARGGFRHPAVRRLDAHAGAVLLLARPGLQGEGVAAAAGGAAGARQGADQHPAARAGREHHHHHAAAGGRSDLGQARRHVRDHARHRAAQQAVGFLRRAALRHHRHEARRGRRHRRRADLHRERRRAAHQSPPASASASPSTTCACSRAAPRWACAASISATATS